MSPSQRFKEQERFIYGLCFVVVRGAELFRHVATIETERGRYEMRPLSA